MTDTAPTLFRTFVGRVLITRDAAHMAHWKALGDGSYARHVVLDEFYGAILEKLDEIVEVYQGGFWTMEDVLFPGRPHADNIVNHIGAECGWISENKMAISGGNAAIGNLLDELCGIYMRSLYKLRNLK